MGKFEQIVEREIWMQTGWGWLVAEKSGNTDYGFRIKLLEQLFQLIPHKIPQLWLQGLQQKAKQVKVQISYQTKEGKLKSLAGRVERSGTVMSAGQSGDELEIKPVTQYRVTDLA